MFIGDFPRIKAKNVIKLSQILGVKTLAFTEKATIFGKINRL